MARLKTTETSASVMAFIEAFALTEQRKKDSYELLALMERASGLLPKMWGASIIGFGRYHYKYASGHEGDAPLIGFSPRKAAISLYVFTGLEEHRPLLEDLGRFKMGKSCLYVNKLADINTAVLMHLMKATIRYLTSTYSTGSAE